MIAMAIQMSKTMIACPPDLFMCATIAVVAVHERTLQLARDRHK
jgi:hypothetical protein